MSATNRRSRAASWSIIAPPFIQVGVKQREETVRPRTSGSSSRTRTLSVVVNGRRLQELSNGRGATELSQESSRPLTSSRSGLRLLRRWILLPAKGGRHCRDKHGASQTANTINDVRKRRFECRMHFHHGECRRCSRDKSLTGASTVSKPYQNSILSSG